MNYQYISFILIAKKPGAIVCDQQQQISRKSILELRKMRSLQRCYYSLTHNIRIEIKQLNEAKVKLVNTPVNISFIKSTQYCEVMTKTICFATIPKSTDCQRRTEVASMKNNNSMKTRKVIRTF